MPRSTRKCLFLHTNDQEDASSKTAQGDLPSPFKTQSTLHATVGARLDRALRRARHAVNVVPGDGPATGNLQVLGVDENCPNPAASRSLRRLAASRTSVSSDRMSNRTVRRRVNKKGVKAGKKRKSIRPAPVDEKDAALCPSEVTAEKRVQSPLPASPNSEEEEQESRETSSSEGLQDAQEEPGRKDTSDVVCESLKSTPSATVDIEPSYSGKLVGWKTTYPTNPYILPTPPGSSDTESEEFETRSDITARTIEDSDDEKMTLIIRPYEPNVVIWDAFRNTYHSFKCKLVLKSTDVEQIDMFSDPHVDRIEFACSTFSPRGHYAFRRSSVLYTRYQGATITSDDQRITVLAKDGVHIDETWKSMKDEDGTWGWYVHVWTPIPLHLFEKVDARLFRMVSRLWIRGRKVAEAETIFSVSALFKQLDMV
ncbi:hypothetical protein F5I97DRAFT_1879958 [Phlebopus sp. FC_14]|nr:hypothetical protein F5I97DRAFT_1879958 [Phlebopus sp. FC_14]